MAERIKNMREVLLQAGIGEINEHGVNEFSIRRVADACGVSCAAPYKHFKDKRDFIAAVIDYVNSKWIERRDEVLASCSPDLEEQIIEVSISYIRFLMEEPYYRSILTLRDGGFDNLYHKKHGELVSVTQQLQIDLLQATGMSTEEWNRKALPIRAIVFGSVLLFESREFQYSEKAMEDLRHTMRHIFHNC